MMTPADEGALLRTHYDALQDRIWNFNTPEKFINDTPMTAVEGMLGKKAQADLRVEITMAAKSLFWRYRSEHVQLHKTEDGFREDMANIPIHESVSADNAYTLSSNFYNMLNQMVYDDLYYNQSYSILDNPYHCVGEIYFNPDLLLEARSIIIFDGHPHLSILSIQPFQAASSRQLLQAELWMLIYWAKRYVTRVTMPDDFPIRLVSICDKRARFVYATFSPTYIWALNGKRLDRYIMPPALCRIHIEEYQDLTSLEGVKAIMQELLDEPTGTQGLSKHFEERERRARKRRLAAEQRAIRGLERDT